MQTFIRHHLLVTILTLLIWGLVGIYLGPAAFVLVVILTLLEMTLSADNAIVNSRVLVTMSPLWQKIFITVGIFIAVFVMRFATPIAIVAATTDLDAMGALNLAINDPEEYGHKLHDSAPLIDGFGGMFLLMVALFFFVDASRKALWIRPLENVLKRVGTFGILKYLIAFAVVGLVYTFVETKIRDTVAVAMITGLGVYLILHAITVAMERFGGDPSIKHKTGWAAFAAFVYLEVLDASFSLDGVVGAFALTNNIVIIMAGLGIGALWVRTMTIHLVEQKTLMKYRYLESGAHWAILLLSLIMLGKLFHIELPEIVIGTVGLICIGFSLISSRRYKTIDKL